MSKIGKPLGFTLVELAIVLVIIGLLIGGVLQGQELIRQAQIRSIISDIGSFTTATNTFSLKYNAFPGDMRTAAAYGVNCPAGVTCSSSTDNVAHTDCDAGADGADGDGNGNGSLEGSTCAAYIEFYSGEIANFWVHLSNTQLIKGGFTQTDNCDEDTCNYVAGTNFPETPMGRGIIAITSQGMNWILGVAVAGNGWTLSGIGATEGAGIIGDELSPSDSLSIDQKLDDGRPNLGIVRAISSYNSSTGVFTDDAVNAGDCTAVAGEYNVSTNTHVCTLKIKSL